MATLDVSPIDQCGSFNVGQKSALIKVLRALAAGSPGLYGAATAPLDMGGFKIVNLADGSAPQDAKAFNQA